MKHKASVRFNEQRLSRPRLPKGWSSQKNGDGQVGASGPCPVCFGDAYGPTIPDVGLKVPSGDSALLDIRRNRDGDAETSRDVYVECACGFDHGKAGATSCGATWIVEIKGAQK